MKIIPNTPIAIVGAGTARGKNLEEIARSPSFRKATPNMVLTYAALEEATRALPRQADLRAGMVLGSNFGELDYTQNFLTTLAESGVARPFLFQSSLHNATIGFLSVQLGITGPTLTLSSHHLAGERCLETAILLLSTGAADLCVASCIEMVPQTLAEPIKLLASQGLAPVDGAGALLLANNTGLSQLSCAQGERAPIAWIEEIRIEPASGIAGSAVEGADSNAIEALALALQQASMDTLRLPKPDGTVSTLRWRSEPLP